VRAMVSILVAAIALLTAMIYLQMTPLCQATEPAMVAPASTASRVPVVVELFTSEGCSSCPPADRLLQELDAEQPVSGTEILVLSEHVDYWDRLGWKDPFSSPQFTARQNAYARAFGSDSVYTPQMVVDGRIEFVGSDRSRARQAIAAATRQPRTPLELKRAPVEKDSGLGLQIHAGALLSGDKEADVFLAVTESKLVSDILRGENSGRTIAHTGVVRRLEIVGRAVSGAGESFRGEARILLDPGWRRENLRAVVFVQERRSRRILGAAAVSLAAGMQ